MNYCKYERGGGNLPKLGMVAGRLPAARADSRAPAKTGEQSRHAQRPSPPADDATPIQKTWGRPWADPRGPDAVGNSILTPWRQWRSHLPLSLGFALLVRVAAAKGGLGSRV
jgi:hypothetical protein